MAVEVYGAGGTEKTKQTKTVTPSTSLQRVTADSEDYELETVNVQAMPAGLMSDITVSTSGLITSKIGTSGYLAQNTQKTKQLSTVAAQSYMPGTEDREIIASGKYTTGSQKVKGDANLLAENIKKGVSIFNTLGTYLTEGTYLWQKYSGEPGVKVTNPEITLNIQAANGIATITSTNFDTDYLDSSWTLRMIDFFKDFTSADGTKFAIGTGGSLYLYFQGTSNRDIESFDKSQLKFTYTTGLTYSYTSTLTFSGTKELKAADLTFEGMVVSENASEFPDDGWQDGYYYRKTTALPFGIKAVDFGTYTVASDFTTSSITIPHNLGEAPDFVLFYYPSGNIATTYSMLYSIRSNKLGFRSSTYNVYCGYHGNTTTSVTTSNSNGSAIGVNNLTATSFKVASYSTTYYWRGGYTYNWIAIKFS